MKTCIYTKSCTQIFIASLFIIAKNGNNSNIHKTNELVNKSYTNELVNKMYILYIGKKKKWRNKVLMHTTTEMTLENIMLGDKDLATKDHILYGYIYMKRSRTQIYRDRK